MTWRRAAVAAAVLAGCDGRIENDPEVDDARGALNAILRSDTDPLHGKLTACEQASIQGAEQAFARDRELPSPATRPPGGAVVCAAVEGRTATWASCKDVRPALDRLALVPLDLSACEPPDVSVAVRQAERFDLKESEKKAWLEAVRGATKLLTDWKATPPPKLALRARWAERCDATSEITYGETGKGGLDLPVGAIKSYKCWARLVWLAPDGTPEALANGFGEAHPEKVEYMTDERTLKTENAKTRAKALAAAREALAKAVP